MAAEYFNRLAKDYPDDYVPYLALGDLYTQTKRVRAGRRELSEGLQTGAGKCR